MALALNLEVFALAHLRLIRQRMNPMPALIRPYNKQSYIRSIADGYNRDTFNLKLNANEIRRLNLTIIQAGVLGITRVRRRGRRIDAIGANAIPPINDDDDDGRLPIVRRRLNNHPPPPPGNANNDDDDDNNRQNQPQQPVIVPVPVRDLPKDFYGNNFYSWFRDDRLRVAHNNFHRLVMSVYRFLNDLIGGNMESLLIERGQPEGVRYVLNNCARFTVIGLVSTMKYGELNDEDNTASRVYCVRQTIEETYFFNHGSTDDIRNFLQNEFIVPENRIRNRIMNDFEPFPIVPYTPEWRFRPQQPKKVLNVQD